MADRELLELAAKAAGLVVEWDYDGNTWARRPDEHPEQALRWNPLTDDGDALRLAVKLRLHFAACGHSAIASEPDGVFVQVQFGDDAAAATRRAIVRAAAEIGAHSKQHKDGGANG
ncbi:hypothetical protein D9M72_287320 [compost metagenome]